MDIELQNITTNGNDGTACLSHEQVTAVNGDGAAYIKDATEEDWLFSVQPTSHNGESMTSGHVAESERNLRNTLIRQEISSVCRIKRELNDVVFWKVKLWMAIIFIFLLIFAVILISLVICSAVYEDVEDEKFDTSLFKVPLHFNGSFQLPNLVFTEELFNLSSIESQALAADLQEKLADLYTSSPALGRYFSKAGIYAFRNGSVIADYQLTFLMPEEEQYQLRNFTLSREMVYNVFRQFLYDQEPDEPGPMYIDPFSLNMFLRHY